MVPRSLIRMLLILVMLCAAIGPSLYVVPTARAQGDYVRIMFIFITLSVREGSPSDDPLDIIFYGYDDEIQKWVERHKIHSPAKFGGDAHTESGDTEYLYDPVPDGKLPQSLFADPSNVCLVASGTDGLLIDTLFIIGFDGERWEVYAAWGNDQELWLDTDLRESPYNRAALDLLDGTCTQR